ncbi:hypothetical protein DRQ33_05400 [bacterium]|nr:MAG: hypothetical protein DRQ33_05400 [bacterium]
MNNFDNSHTIASITAIHTAVAQLFCNTPEISKSDSSKCDIEKYGRWFVSAALFRTNLNPNYDYNGKKGLFAIREQTFRSLCKNVSRILIRLDDKFRILLDNENIFDPLANSIATARYIQWAIEKYSSLIQDEKERFLFAFIALDEGYFRIKRAMESIARPII